RWEHTFEKIKSLFCLSEFRISARNIVLGEWVLRPNNQRSRDPLSCTVVFAHLNECSDTQICRPWIFRVKNDLTLGAFDATSCRTVLLLISTKRPVRLNQQY